MTIIFFFIRRWSYTGSETSCSSSIHRLGNTFSNTPMLTNKIYGNYTQTNAGNLRKEKRQIVNIAVISNLNSFHYETASASRWYEFSSHLTPETYSIIISENSFLLGSKWSDIVSSTHSRKIRTTVFVEQF